MKDLLTFNTTTRNHEDLPLGLSAPMQQQCKVMPSTPAHLCGPFALGSSCNNISFSSDTHTMQFDWHSRMARPTRTDTAIASQSCNSSRQQAAVYLFVVDTQTSGLFIRAYVSLGPPRHAAQLGLAGVSQPASWKIWDAVLPSQPGTGMPYTSIHTFCVAGTRYVGTLTLPPALCISLAAAMKSSVLPPVQDLRTAALLASCFA